MSVDLVCATTRRIVKVKMLLPFLSRVLVQLIDFHDSIVEWTGGKALVGEAMNVMSKVEQVTTTGVQFLSKMASRHALAEASQNHHQPAGAVSLPLQGRARKQIEDLAALPTPIVNDGLSMAIVRRLIRW